MNSLFRYWRIEPPTQVFVAAYFGYKESDAEQTPKEVTETDSRFLETLGPGKAKSFDNLPVAVQDFFKKKRRALSTALK